MKLLFPTWCGGLGTHRKGETELSDAINRLEGREGIQREPDRLGQWVHGSLTRFSQAKGKITDLGQGNPKCQHRPGRSVKINPFTPTSGPQLCPLFSTCSPSVSWLH